MVTAITEPLKYSSKSQKRRPLAISPMNTAMFCGWASTGLLFVAASKIMHSNMLAAALLLVMGSCLGYYMAVVTMERVRDSGKFYELIIEKDKVVLSSVDKRSNAISHQHLSLRDITLAEYCPMKDASTLVLYGAPSHIEIPLWLFGSSVELQIVEYFLNRGLPMTNLPPELQHKASLHER